MQPSIACHSACILWQLTLNKQFCSPCSDGVLAGDAVDSELSVDLAEGCTLATPLTDQGFSLMVRVLCTSALPDLLWK